MIALDRDYNRFRSRTLEVAGLLVVVGTFVGTALLLPAVRASIRAGGRAGIPVVFLGAPAVQVVVIAVVAIFARWVVRTPQPFPRTWREQQILEETRGGRAPGEAPDLLGEAAFAIEERARRSIVQFLLFLQLLLVMQLAYVQFVVLSLASGRNPGRAGVAIVAAISFAMLVFIGVRTIRGAGRGRHSGSGAAR
jgi:hypothetical protein